MSTNTTQACTACGKTFSADMTYCPYCGTNVPGVVQKNSHAGTMLIAIVIVGGIVGVVLKLAGHL